jgi:hypothetical protein
MGKCYSMWPRKTSDQAATLCNASAASAHDCHCNTPVRGRLQYSSLLCWFQSRPFTSSVCATFVSCLLYVASAADGLVQMISFVCPFPSSYLMPDISRAIPTVILRLSFPLNCNYSGSRSITAVELKSTWHLLISSQLQTSLLSSIACWSGSVMLTRTRSAGRQARLLRATRRTTRFELWF